jgi:hypothetical protein
MRARRAPGGADHGPDRPSVGRVPGRERRDVRVLRVRERRRRSPCPGRHRRRVGAAAGARAVAWPNGLHHQRRVRNPDRGLRPPADDPRAVAPALLPGAARVPGSGKEDRPADVVARDGGAARGDGVPSDDPRCREAGDAGARGRAAEHEEERPRGRGPPLHGHLQRGVGRKLGLRPDHRCRGPLPGRGPEADPER